MRKKAVALAVAGVFAAPAAVLAQSSTVQIYGKVTYEYAIVDPGQLAAGDGQKYDNADNPGGSNIGFRGQEKLGGGLTAWFQCESSVDVRGLDGSTSDTANGWCTRNSAVGFKGGWGNLHFGRWDSPFKRALNQGSTGAIGETGALGTSWVAWGGSGGTSAVSKTNRQRWKRRDVGWTYYESPKFSGFQVLAGFTPGNGAAGTTTNANNNTPRVLSIGALFDHGPLSLGLGYEEHQQFGPSAGATGDLDDKGWSLAAAYTFAGKIEVGATYLDNKYEQIDGDIKRKSWTLGVDWKIAGPHSVRAFYAQAEKTKGSSLTAIPGGSSGNIPAPCTAVGVCGADNGAKDWSIGYGYSFSKRTFLQIGVHVTDNDSAGQYRIGNAAQPVAGEKQTAYGAHIAHRF